MRLTIAFTVPNSLKKSGSLRRVSPPLVIRQHLEQITACLRRDVKQRDATLNDGTLVKNDMDCLSSEEPMQLASLPILGDEVPHIHVFVGSPPRMADVVRDLKTDFKPKEASIHEGDRGTTNHCFKVGALRNCAKGALELALQSR